MMPWCQSCGALQLAYASAGLKHRPRKALRVWAGVDGEEGEEAEEEGEAPEAEAEEEGQEGAGTSAAHAAAAAAAPAPAAEAAPAAATGGGKSGTSSESTDAGGYRLRAHGWGAQQGAVSSSAKQPACCSEKLSN